MKKILALVVLMTVASGCGVVPLGAPPATPTSLPTATSTVVPTATNTPKPSATPTAAATATSTAVPTPANASDSLSKLFKGWATIKSFRATSTTTGLPTGTQVTNIEVVMPDRFHLTTKDVEMYLIGKNFYMKVANKWQKLALPQGFDLSMADLSRYASTLVTTTNVKFVGADVVDGTPIFVYSYTSTYKGPPPLSMNQKVWVGVLDNLPRKMESSPKAGQLTTTTYSDYNSAITINAPM